MFVSQTVYDRYVALFELFQTFTLHSNIACFVDMTNPNFWSWQVRSTACVNCWISHHQSCAVIHFKCFGEFFDDIGMFYACADCFGVVGYEMNDALERRSEICRIYCLSSLSWKLILKKVSKGNFREDY